MQTNDSNAVHLRDVDSVWVKVCQAYSDIVLDI